MNRRFILVPVVLLLGIPSSHAAEKDDAAATLRLFVDELITLQVEANEEATRWKEQQEHLDTTLTLLKKEKSQLDAEMSELEKRIREQSAEEALLKERKEKASALLDRLDQTARAFSSRLLAQVQALPEPLRHPFQHGSSRLRAAAAGDTRKDTAGLLQLALALASDLHRTLSTVHLVKQSLQVPSGETLEMDVLYVGGAIGYYVSPDRRHAGIVLRGAEGWQTIARDEFSPRVTEALAVFRKERPAALVSLPVQVEK